MARINWNKSAPYEHIVGKETGEKIYAIMEYLGVGKKHEALRFAIDFTCKELIEKPFKPAEPERKWTPITEALPKDRDWYLGIFMESDTGYVIPVPYVCNYVGRETPITTKDFWILRDIDEPHEYHKNLKCVAWMPLPEPWRGE